MTPLHLVTEQHSVRVLPSALTTADIADFEYIAESVWPHGKLALREMELALERRDRDAVIASCRRLLAVGMLAKISADRVEARS